MSDKDNGAAATAEAPVIEKSLRQRAIERAADPLGENFDKKCKMNADLLFHFEVLAYDLELQQRGNLAKDAEPAPGPNGNVLLDPDGEAEVPFINQDGTRATEKCKSYGQRRRELAEGIESVLAGAEDEGLLTKVLELNKGRNE